MGLPPALDDKKIKNLPGTEFRCRNCGNLTYKREDEYHGEIICQKCGYVQLKKAEKTITELVQRATPKQGHDLHPDLYEMLSQDEKSRRILQLENNYNTKTNSKAEWRYVSLYKPYILILHREHHLTRYQQKWMKRALDRLPYFGGLDSLCKNCSYQQILTSLAIRLMRREGRRFSINTNKFCKSIGLNSKKYYNIIENLEILQEKGLINREKVNKSKLKLEESNENLRKEIEMITVLNKIKQKKGRRGADT